MTKRSVAGVDRATGATAAPVCAWRTLRSGSERCGGAFTVAVASWVHPVLGGGMGKAPTSRRPVPHTAPDVAPEGGAHRPALNVKRGFLDGLVTGGKWGALPASARSVVLVVYHHMNSKTGRAKLSDMRMHVEAGVSLSSVLRAKTTLAERGIFDHFVAGHCTVYVLKRLRPDDVAQGHSALESRLTAALERQATVTARRRQTTAHVPATMTGTQDDRSPSKPTTGPLQNRRHVPFTMTEQPNPTNPVLAGREAQEDRQAARSPRRRAQEQPASP